MSKDATKPVSVDPTSAYLAEIGVQIDPGLLAPPDVDTLIAAAVNPFEWLDRRGDAVPDAAGIELYRVEEIGEPHTDQVIRAKESEGFRELPPGHGFRMRGLHTPDKERVMIRTAAQKEAAAQAMRLRYARRRTGKETARHAVAGSASSIEMTIARRDEKTPVLRP